jgi:glycosyltransferase involved in cell wall biosynthesis
MISIIIATYNRAAYIEETLKSIQNQTYTDFECIIVDDGSTDRTEEMVLEFVKNDKRFNYLHRPDNVAKGANYSRNYGYTFSKGSHIKFFDSDDVMLPHHLETSMKYFEKGDYDFVVGDCINFDTTGILERPYEIDRSTAELTAMRFVDFKTGWITNDLLVKREFADQITFLAGMRDQASEYQYNIKLLLITQNGFLIDEILTHRRIHDDGLVVKANKENVWLLMSAELYIKTIEYLKDIAPQYMLEWLLDNHVQVAFKLTTQKKWPENVLKATLLLLKIKGVKGLLYPVVIGTSYLTGKGYQGLKYIRK